LTVFSHRRQLFHKGNIFSPGKLPAVIIHRLYVNVHSFFAVEQNFFRKETNEIIGVVHAVQSAL
jgi:hypothetical protein